MSPAGHSTFLFSHIISSLNARHRFNSLMFPNGRFPDTSKLKFLNISSYKISQTEVLEEEIPMRIFKYSNLKNGSARKSLYRLSIEQPETILVPCSSYIVCLGKGPNLHQFTLPGMARQSRLLHYLSIPLFFYECVSVGRIFFSAPQLPTVISDRSFLLKEDVC